MYPVDIEEFLYANGVGEEVIKNMKESFDNVKELNEALHIRILDLFKKNLLVGGLPDAINSYIENNNIQYIRDIQSETTNYYREDAGNMTKNITYMPIYYIMFL